MGGRKGVFNTPAGEGGAGEPPLASDALEVSADSRGFLLGLLSAVMCSICPFSEGLISPARVLVDFGLLGPERSRFENSIGCTKSQTPRPILSSTRGFPVFRSP